MSPLSAEILARVRGKPREPIPSEWQALQAIADGCTQAGAARRLNRSPFTVRNQLDRIYKKLGVTNNIDAIRIGVQRGKISFPQRSSQP